MTYLEKSKQIAIEMAKNNPGSSWGYRAKRNGDYVGEVRFDGTVLEITEF
jgi:hypothetical protein